MITIACVCGGLGEAGLIMGLITLCACVFRKIFKKRK